MKIRIEKKVTVITPTIGSEKVKKAIRSVAEQTYQNVEHLLVSDGPEYLDRVNFLSESSHKAKVSCTPENTGKNGFYGHRIYASYPHLINSDYILFLDEDNWFKPNHVETLVDVLDKNHSLDFSYSLRDIHDMDETFICPDDCESLGQWPIWITHSDPGYLIDTSSFCFRGKFIQDTCHFWHSGWGGDRRYLYHVMDFAKYETSGYHTLCYRLDGNPNSVKPDFFIQGNQFQVNHYEGVLPWNRTI